MMKNFFAAVGLTLALISAAHAQPAQSVKIGVLTDMSGPLSDAYGPGSVYGAQLAVEDARAGMPGFDLQVVSGDHQNKADVGSAIARSWFDTEHVDVVVDLVNTAVAIAVQDVARQHHRISIPMTGASSLNGKYCSPWGITWSTDTHTLVSSVVRGVVQDGGDTWFFLTADYSGTREMEDQATDIIRQLGGKMLGHALYPLGATEQSSNLLAAQASGARIIGISGGGLDTVNAIKQANEFGLLAQGKRIVAPAFFLTDVNALGLPVAHGTLFSVPFYWDLNDATRAWSKRFFEHFHKMPTHAQAGAYTSITHYLKAVKAAGTTDPDRVIAKMREIPIDDFNTQGGRVLSNGSVSRQRYVMQVKSPDESHYPWDYLKIVKALSLEESAPIPPEQSGCDFSRP
jgi:branched-chain amino acid transport system substrate-binding protein